MYVWTCTFYIALYMFPDLKLPAIVINNIAMLLIGMCVVTCRAGLLVYCMFACLFLFMSMPIHRLELSQRSLVG